MKRKFNIKNPIELDFHRSGWKFVVNNLIRHTYNPDGVFLSTHFETDVKINNFIKVPWVGFLHNTPNHPPSMKIHPSLDDVCKSDVWKNSMKNCKGLYVFSDYIKKWIETNMFDNVVKVWHPTEMVDRKFDFNKFENKINKKVIFIGHWMRKFESFELLKVRNDFKKVMFITRNHTPLILNFGYDFKILSKNPDITYLKYIENEKYDKMLSESVVFIDLYDASANNSVIECIVRNTPVLVTRLPATVEYLGDEYPFFFNDLDEASNKVSDLDLILKTHKYLCSLDKSRFGINYFLKNIFSSKIYESL